jgi:predicted DNA-binding transcriptional regulator AlpA
MNNAIQQAYISDKRYLRLPQILELIPIGKSTWWAGIKSGRFPKGVKLGPRTTAWRAEDIHQLLNDFSNGGE